MFWADRRLILQPNLRDMTPSIQLTTARLLLRTPGTGDAGDVFALMSDEEIARNVGFRPMASKSEAEGKIRRAMTDRLMFVIAESARPGSVVGVFEVAPHVAGTTDGEKTNYEICYFLSKEVRGKGYMTEATERMKAYLFSERAADSLTIAVLPRNDASRRVALKCGFTYAGLDRQCGLTFRDEWVDLEFYTLDRDEYLNPGRGGAKERVHVAEKQKWINEGGVLYPIPGYATLLPGPGRGIFRINEEPRTKRLGLEKIDETFVFPFKLYDLDCEDVMNRIIRTWTSDVFAASNKNLGVIFNGLKGTGKTIAAKLLCNRLGLPVVVVSKPLDGMLEFVQSLCFECVVLIDEAEKTFSDEREVLLKMIDGVYNASRKLYVLTTNRLTVDENLLGRPGRIRYIKEFSNLSPKAVSSVIDDNLHDLALKDDVLRLVDTLEISTIDILKSVIEECNITGEVPAGALMNIPKAKYRIRLVTFDGLELPLHRALREFVAARLSPYETVEQWLLKSAPAAGGESDERNKEAVEKKFDCKIGFQVQPSVSPVLYVGQPLRYGNVGTEPDKLGFFTIESDWDEPELYCLGNRSEQPSLYRGSLC